MDALKQLAFCYHPDILRDFPDICGGVILASNIQNGDTPPQLLQAFADEQHLTLARVGESPPAEILSLAAWRSAFRTFGVDPTRYRSAAESLLRRLTKKGDIPSINALVDLCNLVSIRYLLPVAVFDARALTTAVTVHFAAGNEAFIAHDQPEPEFPEPGEVIFTCGESPAVVIARRWCWKQSAGSAARLDTTGVLITTEAQHAGGRMQVQSALTDLLALLTQFCSGNSMPTFQHGIVDGEAPRFPA
jgi:DNA/RNA-binding domain of Phe-tRNA-synthetase-like protein